MQKGGERRLKKVCANPSPPKRKGDTYVRGVIDEAVCAWGRGTRIQKEIPRGRIIIGEKSGACQKSVGEGCTRCPDTKVCKRNVGS